MWKATPWALALVFVLTSECHGLLKVGFYRGKCGKFNVEKVIFKVVKIRAVEDPTTIPKLIRLQFHDCFVRGCDASILLDGWYTEKNASQNRFLRGYDIIDEAKIALEKRCPGVVSCADIIIIASRVAIFLGGSKWYNVETGRRDGRISSAKEAFLNIPQPTASISTGIKQFAKKGLNLEDFVVLLGGHSVGAAHCANIRYRLYNFHNTRTADPRMGLSLVWSLKRQCPFHKFMKHDDDNVVTSLDQTLGSKFVVDNTYYKAILAGESVLEIDQQLALHRRTRGMVKKLAIGNEFAKKIGPAMVKMGRIGVLTGHYGEIRRSCRCANKH